MRTDIFVWRYTAVLFVLVLVASEVNVASSSYAGALDKITFPRGNHWAVGHLMGKKSTDTLYESEEVGTTSNEYLLTPKETRQLDKQLQSPQLLISLIRAFVGLETANGARTEWKVTQERNSHWKETEEEKNLRKVQAWKEVPEYHYHIRIGMKHCYWLF